MQQQPHMKAPRDGEEHCPEAGCVSGADGDPKDQGGLEQNLIQCYALAVPKCGIPRKLAMKACATGLMEPCDPREEAFGTSHSSVQQERVSVANTLYGATPAYPDWDLGV